MKRSFTILTAALALLACLAIPVGMWGQTSTYSLTPDQSSTGSNATSYITTLTEFSYNSISWKMNQWNPKTLQIKTNQGSAASEFRFYNTAAFPGRITQVVIKFSALTVSNSNGFMFVGGTSQVTGTTGGTAGTWNSTTKTITWTPGASDNYTYFAFYQNGKVASGTNYLASSDAIVVTYESGSNPPTPTTHALTFSADPSAGGGVSVNNGNITSGASIAEGTQLSIAATVASGYEFVNWTATSGTIADANNANTTFTMGSADAELVAHFTESTPPTPSLNVTYDFTSNNNFYTQSGGTEHPSTGSTNNVTAFYYGNGDAFTASGASSYFSSGYFLFGKAGALLNLPTYQGYKITQIIIHNSNGGSTNVKVSIVSGNNTAAAEIQWSTQGTEYTYNIGSAYQTSALSVKVTNNYNAQITGITVVREEINANRVETPTFSPAGGIIVADTDVTISCETTGATIYYTLDGSTPDGNSTVYNNQAIPVSATTTIKAIAMKSGMENSNVAEATFTRKYTITVNQAQGGTISASSLQAEAGASITLTATANVGYTFGSWSVTPVSITIASTDNPATFSMPASDVTVTASFNTATAYTVSFSINGKIEMTATVNSGNSIDLTKFVAEGNGYTFEGWSTTAGEEIITPQNAYTPTGNIILYPGVAPAPTGDEYTLVTNVSQLEAGNLVVIAANGDKNWAMSTDQRSNNRGTAILTKNANGTITIPEEGDINGNFVCQLTLGTTNGHWTFYDATNSGYLYAVANNNYLRTQSSNDANGEWTISISNNEATITAQGEFTSNRVLKYNSSSDIFSCYTSGQQTVWLYTKPAAKSARGNRDGVPTTSKVTSIAANVIVTVKADGIVYLTGSNAGNEANLIVEDGGQLVTSNDVKGTMQKTIIGYSSSNPGWYFISSPLTTTKVSQVQNLVDGTYDLYYFDQNPEIVDGIGLEWINYKATSFESLFSGSGYLYANADPTTTLGFAGTLRKNMGSEDYATYNKSITYEVQGQGGDPNMAGWNLVGNPFPSNAKVDRGFYKMNNTSDGINPTVVSANSVIGPMEGVFVLATENEQNPKVTFTATTDSPTAKSRGININVARQGEMLDNAIVSLNAGSSLCKLILSDNTTKVYFHQDQKDYAIIASPSENEVPVSFKASHDGSYTITVSAEDVEMDYLHLIDNMTGANVDLLANPSYSFKTTTTDYSSRFRLVFSATSTEAENGTETFAYFNGSEWMVSNEGEANLQVIDLTGRVISSETINGTVAKAINVTPGIYMLRLVNNNEVKTQKILVK